jgi:hypothetical protein
VREINDRLGAKPYGTADHDLNRDRLHTIARTPHPLPTPIAHDTALRCLCSHKLERQMLVRAIAASNCYSPFEKFENQTENNVLVSGRRPACLCDRAIAAKSAAITPAPMADTTMPTTIPPTTAPIVLPSPTLPQVSAREAFHFRFAVQLEPNESRTFSRHRSGGKRMHSHGPLRWTPRQYHARHPHQCFVCRRTFTKGSTRTHEETGARTCSALCFTQYARWWLREKPTQPPSLAPLDTAPH